MSLGIAKSLVQEASPSVSLGGRTVLPAGEKVQVANPSDEDLVQALRAGDNDSLGVLVARWERPLFRFAYRLLERRDDARDVCQETFLRILDKSDRFREGARFSTWMYQIALNLCRDHLRRKRRWGALVRSAGDSSPDASDRLESIPGSEDPALDLESSERREALTRALEDIPSEQREVLILKEFEGLKFREIAVILGCPESTVKSRMYYGLTGLRSALERQGIEGL